MKIHMLWHTRLLRDSPFFIDVIHLWYRHPPAVEVIELHLSNPLCKLNPFPCSQVHVGLQQLQPFHCFLRSSSHHDEAIVPSNSTQQNILFA